MRTYDLYDSDPHFSASNRQHVFRLLTKHIKNYELYDKSDSENSYFDSQISSSHF